jgi:hypothetical protein
LPYAAFWDQVLQELIKKDNYWCQAKHARNACERTLVRAIKVEKLINL